MKTTRLFAVTLALLLPSSLSEAAEPSAPVLKESGEWIVISMVSDSHRGVVPRSFAIRKQSIVSVQIDTASIIAGDREAQGGSVRYDQATLEELQKVPAEITITTNERAADGGGMRWEIRGLTHETAPAMLEKILGMTGGASSKDGN